MFIYCLHNSIYHFYKTIDVIINNACVEQLAAAKECLHEYFAAVLNFTSVFLTEVK